MSNHRQKCSFCKELVLSRTVGSHILKNHPDSLFVNQNLKELHKDKNFSQPLELSLGDETTYHFFCLADNSCIRKEKLALEHFKGKKDIHREIILKLREKYPLSGDQPDKPRPSAPLMTTKELKWLQDLIMDIVASKDENVVLTPHCRTAFIKLGLKTDEDDLKDLFPHHEHFGTHEDTQEAEEEAQETKEKEETPDPEEEPEPLPLLLPKPLTREEVFHKLMTPKDIKALTTSLVSGKTIEIPELQQFHKTTTILKPSDLEFAAARVQPQEQSSLKIITTTKRMPKQV